MNPLDALSACAGSWLGRLQDPHAGIAAESPSAVSVRGPPGGVRLTDSPDHGKARRPRQTNLETLSAQENR